jgi:ACS family glucarate transporter-like MFS transporter
MASKKSKNKSTTEAGACVNPMIDLMKNSDDALRPSRVRYRVVAFAILLAMVTYLDRACIATLRDNISGEFEFTDGQMGWVFSAFAISYALFEIPTAMWADRIGTRLVLTRIVVWWSSFTMVTAAATGYRSLLAIRFLFGMGEAGAWPSVAKTFSHWIPRRQRGTIQGMFFAGAHLAGGITPFITTFLLDRGLPWRAILVLFGSIGLIWAFCWHRWYRDDPTEHPGVNAAELQLIVSERDLGKGHHGGWEIWRRTIFNRNVLALCLMYFPNSVGFYFCITWLQKYLKEKHEFAGQQLALFMALPLIFSVFPDMFGGATTDWAVRRFGLRMGRVGVGFLSYFVAGCVMLSATIVEDSLIAATLIAVATASSMFLLGAAWGACIEIGGDHAGVVSATMNTAGQIASVISPVVIPYVAGKTEDWNAPIYLIGGLYLFGAVCWCFIDPRRKVLE